MSQAKSAIDFAHQIILDFPKDCLAIGYGSCFLETSQAAPTRPRLVDILLVTPNPDEFHREVFTTQPELYDGQRYNQDKAIFRQRCFPLLYFTMLSKRGRGYKVGVVSKEAFLRDLRTWEVFTLAGRLQKPFVSLTRMPEEVQSAIDFNRESALLLAALTCEGQSDLFRKIIELPYVGDIRFRLGIEGEAKLGQLEQKLQPKMAEIYAPMLAKFGAEVRRGPSPPARDSEDLWRALSERRLSVASGTPRAMLEKLERLNLLSSAKMAWNQLLFGGLSKNLLYLAQKVFRK